MALSNSEVGHELARRAQQALKEDKYVEILADDFPDPITATKIESDGAIVTIEGDHGLIVYLAARVIAGFQVTRSTARVSAGQ